MRLSSINKILIADDNDLNSKILSEILKLEGYKSDIARDGEQVIAMFQESAENLYSVILMDINMPKVNGWKAATKIRQMDRLDSKTVKIYACTGSDYEEDRKKAREVGMNGLLGKPLNVDDLVCLLRRDFG